MSRTTPRRRTVTFAPVPTITSSPTSVVWHDPPIERPFDDDDDDEEEEELPTPPFELPSLDEINDDLQKLVKKSASSKASYRAKLSKMSNELKDANLLVQTLEQELNAARNKQAIVQRAMEDARQQREDENERLTVRKLHLQILRRCMTEWEVRPEIQKLRESDSPDVKKYANHSSHELALIRRRLEGVRALLDKADKADGSKDSETRTQAETMKREAISTYILFHKFSQV